MSTLAQVCSGACLHCLLASGVSVGLTDGHARFYVLLLTTVLCGSSMTTQPANLTSVILYLDPVVLCRV